MKNTSKILKLSAIIVLIAVMALSVFSCAKAKEDVVTGEKTITVEVINSAGEHKDHVLSTETSTLADALKEAGFTDGEDSDYGYYITTVDGELADYSVDSSYWSISQNGEELMTGASSTDIADGDHYELTYTIYSYVPDDSADVVDESASNAITITVEVINSAGEHTDHVLATATENLADALKEAGFTEGEDGDYGYFITTVDGELADYSVDGSYWSISKDGEELMTGASSTEIADGDHFELTYTIYG